MSSMLPKGYPYKVEAYCEWISSLYFYDDSGELWRYVRGNSSRVEKSSYNSIDEMIRTEVTRCQNPRGVIIGEARIAKYLMMEELSK